MDLWDVYKRQGLNKVTKKDRAYTKRLVDKAIEDNLIYISNDEMCIRDSNIRCIEILKIVVSLFSIS